MAQGKKNPGRISGAPINPQPVRGDMTAAELIDTAFLAYNGRRLREACRLFAEKMLADDTVVGMSVTGALTPAGLGMSCLIPLIENGFVDWMVSTGANLYHDTHFGLGLKMFQGSAEANDIELREKGIVRIYDIFFDYEVLLSTDAFFREIAAQQEFQQPMSSAEFHYRAGRYVAERERVLGLKRRSLLAAAKNFVLQTEPQIQEVLGVAEKGHDYFLQITDARPDTGGLSGATPSEAVSWGKIDPERLPDSVHPEKKSKRARV